MPRHYAIFCALVLSVFTWAQYTGHHAFSGASDGHRVSSGSGGGTYRTSHHK